VVRPSGRRSTSPTMQRGSAPLRGPVTTCQRAVIPHFDLLSKGWGFESPVGSLQPGRYRRRRAGARPGRRGAVEGRIGAEDGQLEIAKVVTEVEAECIRPGARRCPTCSSGPSAPRTGL
jgi:hypothetical protein